MPLCVNKRKNFSLQHETPKEHQERVISHYIIYFTQFNVIISYSIVLVGLWPYLNKLDPTSDKSFLGYLVGSSALGQAIFSPLIGWWGNKLKSNRIPFISCMLIFFVSFLIHATVGCFENHKKYWLLFSRFLSGVGSACVSICRSHISTTTLIKERRKAMSTLSLTATLSLALGPAFQSAVVPLGESGFWIIKDKLKLDMYTAVGWMLMLLMGINLILFHPNFFKERSMLNKEENVPKKDFYKSTNYKLLAWCVIFMNFIVIFHFMFIKILGTPLVMDEFAMSKARAITLNSLISFIGAIISLVSILLINPLCKIFSEMRLLIIGIFLMIVGRFCFYPITSENLVVYDDKNLFNSTCEDINRCNEEVLGCPLSQTWCESERKISFVQFVAGNVLENIGYSIAITLIMVIFSKVLGSKQQGTWMGFLTAVGSISRVTTPIIISVLYVNYGPSVVTLITNFIFAIITIILLKISDILIIKSNIVENIVLEENDLMNESNEKFKSIT